MLVLYLTGGLYVGHRRTVEDLLVIASSGHVVSCATDGHIKCWDYTSEVQIYMYTTSRLQQDWKFCKVKSCRNVLICIPSCGKEADACMGVQELVYEIEVQEELLCIEYKKSTHQIVAGTESNKVYLGWSYLLLTLGCLWTGTGVSSS